ncbi:hypothetical protein WM40_18860 [Robbsia andropogonis]|uniref:Uncharacterized protein n=1 Tax=Robbsia andropogonis TaxID=28092 RepID=A0A0F5JWG9_9BURK|nr:hypothetical protein [Robbsia andropogonis]KKB62198.1 hypothetical protein WM40_18860 [Robbsia andropogonis]
MSGKLIFEQCISKKIGLLAGLFVVLALNACNSGNADPVAVDGHADSNINHDLPYSQLENLTTPDPLTDKSTPDPITNKSKAPTSSQAPPKVIYMGFMDAGDTIRIDMDSPMKGRLEMTFVRSTLGLSGTVSGSYKQSADGAYIVDSLSLDNAVPAMMRSKLRVAAITFSVVKGATGSMVFGRLDFPKIGEVDNFGYSFQATIPVTTDVLKLAGEYDYVASFVTDAGNGFAPTSHPVMSQIILGADGSLRGCLHPLRCSVMKTDLIPLLGVLAPSSNQVETPGEMEWRDPDTAASGRLYMTYLDGQYRAMVQWTDIGYSSNMYWVPAKPLNAKTMHGNYQCVVNVLHDGRRTNIAGGLHLAPELTAAKFGSSARRYGHKIDYGFSLIPTMEIYGLPAIYMGISSPSNTFAMIDIGADIRFISMTSADLAQEVVGGFGFCAPLK